MSATEESLAETASGAGTDAGEYTGNAIDEVLRPPRGTPMSPSSRPRPGAARRNRTSTAALLILGLSMIGGLLAGLWAVGQGDRHSATAVVQLEPASTIEDNRDVVDIVGSLDRGTIIVTAAGLATSGVVTSGAQEQIGMSTTQAEDYEVESLQVLTSHLIDITVTGPNEATAIAYADAIADELRTSFSQSYPVYQIATVTPATVPDSSGRPGVVVIVIAAMVASAVGGLMLWLALFGGSDQRTDLPLARRS